MPDVVTEQDIPAEVSDEEAHERYAAAAVAFMVTKYADDFQDGDVVQAQQDAYDQQQVW